MKSWWILNTCKGEVPYGIDLEAVNQEEDTMESNDSEVNSLLEDKDDNMFYIEERV